MTRKSNKKFKILMKGVVFVSPEGDVDYTYINLDPKGEWYNNVDKKPHTLAKFHKRYRPNCKIVPACIMSITE